MGIYINPTNGMTKEEFIQAKGAIEVKRPAWPAPFGKVYLSWVNNYAFTAIGVAYNKRELEAFTYIGQDRGDGRPQRFFEIAINDLLVEAGLTEMEQGILNKLQEGK